MQYTLSDRGTSCVKINAGNNFKFKTHEAQALEDFDLIYRTLCGIMFNSVPMSGHPGGSISSGRIVASLILKSMKYNFNNPDEPTNDLLPYAAGHKAMGLYAMWACRNELIRATHPELLPSVENQLRLEDLLGFRKNRTTETPLFVKHKAKPLDGHPTPLVPHVPLSTGASGVGFTAAVGLAWALKDLYGEKAPLVHTLEGEGGLTPGRVHEALAIAATGGLNNFICHLDWNQAAIDSDAVCRDGTTPGDYVQWNPEELFMLHGFNVVSVADGKDFSQVMAGQIEGLRLSGSSPTAIVYRTIKGWQYGIEGKKSHGGGHDFASDAYYNYLAPFEARFGISMPRFKGDKTPTNIEAFYFDSLLCIRDAFTKSKEMSILLGDWIVDRQKALTQEKRAPRANAPKLDKIYSSEIAVQNRPKECSYEPGKSYTLRAALSDVMKHLNGVTGGSFAISAADLYGSTSVLSAGAGFGQGFYHAKNNPTSRVLSAGGICEDAIGGVISGISTVGSHIGVGSSYGAFIAPLHMIADRLHAIGLQSRHERNPNIPFTPFITVNAHAGVKTGEDGPTHAEPNSLQILQENFPGQVTITLTPWDPNELWPLTIAALKQQPAVIAPFVTRPNEPIVDRKALGLAPAEASADGVYKLLAANGKSDGTLIYQGSDVMYAFVLEVLPRLREKGINLDVYYVASAELFDRLPQKERERIYPNEAAQRAMAITGFTLPTTYRWVMSEWGRINTMHPFQKGVYLTSGSANKVMEEAGLHPEAQLKGILKFIER